MLRALGGLAKTTSGGKTEAHSRLRENWGLLMPTFGERIAALHVILGSEILVRNPSSDFNYAIAELLLSSFTSEVLCSLIVEKVSFRSL